MKKVPASEATRKRLEEVFSGEQIAIRVESCARPRG